MIYLNIKRKFTFNKGEYNQNVFKVKIMRTLSGNIVQILGNIESNLEDLLLSNRNIPKEGKEIFFHPSLADLHDPWSLPDMLPAVERILEAREKKERIIIFGDYDVDGVTATTILVRFLSNI
jgi:hypothetical protein